MDKNEALRQRDLAVLWHPTTQMKDHEWLPLLPVSSGNGVWLKDMQGKRYIDAISSWWVNLFGHANPHISGAVAEQAQCLEHVILAGVTHEPAVRLAEKLVDITPPGLERVFFADSGASAVEISLKMSFHYWRNTGDEGRTRFVTLSNSYHGDTLGALSVGDAGLFKSAYEPLLMEPLVAPSPDCFALPRSEWDRHAENKLADMREIFARHEGEICAVIIEPLVQCAGGMRMYPASYLTGLRSLCDEYNIHLIADEIAVGFARTGSMFACEQGGISPDFMCVSKGLTGGYLPMSAVLTSEQVYTAFYAEYTTLRGFLHSHSYTGNALACAAALATLELFEQRDVLADNRRLARLMLESVSELQDDEHIGDIRQTGMILAVEMVAQREPMIQYDWKERRGMKVYQHALQQGVLLRPIGNTVYFMPPYVINPDEIGLIASAAIDGIRLATAD
ncbi:MAG: adenosylmethionine--8-amino-7-oxononanoate transaminase [Xanthomonadales bacterium]|nr:adenosylmethionine--8-amino-7-oxononanoate transaminase [Gammaproteobacteria bacterium]NNK05011.1 adenosylmethionine--8-amino-7-oxononanoate transaminase [Xanthomonadales bacterium]